MANLWLPPIRHSGQLQWVPEDAQRRFDAGDMRARADRSWGMPGREAEGVASIIACGRQQLVQRFSESGRAGRAKAKEEKDGCDRAGGSTTGGTGQHEETGCGNAGPGYRRRRSGRKRYSRTFWRADIGDRRRSGQAAQLQNGNVFHRICAVSRRGHQDLSHFDIGGQK